MTVLHSTGGLFLRKAGERDELWRRSRGSDCAVFFGRGRPYLADFRKHCQESGYPDCGSAQRPEKDQRQDQSHPYVEGAETNQVFSVPHDKLKEFAKEAKARGLLYVVIHDTKHPELSEIMVYADDAAKVNRVLDQLNLDYVSAEVGEAVVEQAPEKEGANQRKADGKSQTEKGKDQTEVRTEKVVLPEGTIEFELDENEHLFDVGEPSFDDGNFTQAQGKGNPSEPSLRSSGSTSGRETSWQEKKPSVRQELKQIQKDQNQRHKKQEPRKRPRNRNRNKTKKMKTKGR